MDSSCHAKFANHHCWFDVLALIRQTGYEVSSLSVPVISHIYAPLIRLRRMALYKFTLIDDWAVCYKNHLDLLVIDYTFKV